MSELELKNLLGILRESFQAIFGEQFDRMLLFGSRARGDARADSDIDLLVVLRDEFDYGMAIAHTSEIVARLSLENDLVISRSFVAKKRFEQEKSPFLLNVQREGMLV
ncbi:MAG: nucleotidyltransferase domain-containing protein [Chloroflexi bacterium]|nr:nucleotidyltransferase domain-containing protein [Chloroflexota bacterium]